MFVVRLNVANTATPATTTPHELVGRRIGQSSEDLT
jgi:hypothetical protein